MAVAVDPAVPTHTNSGQTWKSALAKARALYAEGDYQYVAYYLLYYGYVRDNSDESYAQAMQLFAAVEQEAIDAYEKESDQIFPE